LPKFETHTIGGKKRKEKKHLHTSQKWKNLQFSIAKE
jgi:hypothetical protein